MEFWGVEVKPGQTVKYQPGDDRYLHLSQAALGVSDDDQSDDAEVTTLYVKLDGAEKIAIGSLSVDKFPHVQFDLCVKKGFELSHTSKTDNVSFCGYKVEFDESSSDT